MDKLVKRKRMQNFKTLGNRFSTCGKRLGVEWINHAIKISYVLSLKLIPRRISHMLFWSKYDSLVTLFLVLKLVSKDTNLIFEMTLLDSCSRDTEVYTSKPNSKKVNWSYEISSKSSHKWNCLWEAQGTQCTKNTHSHKRPLDITENK